MHKGGYEDMSGVIFPVGTYCHVTLHLARHFTTGGLGTIAFLGALVDSLEG